MMFKGNKVWLATDRNGLPLVRNGKWLIKYQPEQDHEYWVRPENVLEVNEANAGQLNRKQSEKDLTGNTVHGEPFPDFPENAILVYTDGASSGNPGPSGIGVVLRHGKHEKEISRYIGIATNNIAELEAIRTGLSHLKSKQLPVCIFTDSSYALGVLSKGWKATKNQELVAETKALMATFKNLRLIKVKGHAGNEGNEKADQLAVNAIVEAQK